VSNNRSDGPQPHLLNIHFAKRVFVSALRLYLDFENDESYTPTKLSLLSGTGYHDLQEFAELSFEQPKGWITVDLSGVRHDGVLRTMLLQVCVRENHQNGKDTHVRGLQIFARDENTWRSRSSTEDVDGGFVGRGLGLGVEVR
jgi:anaphase-promoting complex subunit 10